MVTLDTQTGDGTQLATSAAVPVPDETAGELGIVHVIQSCYHYRNTNGHPATQEALLVDEGWFEDAASAATRCAQLNAQNRVHYENSWASDQREHDEKIRVAEQENREAAAIRAAGMPKKDVRVPRPFLPEPFERFLLKTSHTSYETVQIRRSDHDGIARASVNTGSPAHPVEQSSTE